MSVGFGRVAGNGKLAPTTGLRRHPLFEFAKCKPIFVPPRIPSLEAVAAGEPFIRHKAQHGYPTDITVQRPATCRSDAGATNGRAV